jgi:hypothetical protein
LQRAGVGLWLRLLLNNPGFWARPVGLIFCLFGKIPSPDFTRLVPRPEKARA